MGEEDLVGVRVDAARKLAKDPLLRRDAFMGDDCIAPILRFVMDAARDCVLTFRIGATVGAAYIFGIFGTGGALTGVENALDVEVFIDGIDRFILILASSYHDNILQSFCRGRRASGAQCLSCSKVSIGIRQSHHEL